MAVNKVVYDGETIIDLTDSTVSPASLAEGATAYDASGTKVTGTMPTSSVLYGKEQNLTEAQKAQARENIGISDATTSVAGLMTAADKEKLDNSNVAYGTCSTAAGTAEKAVVLNGNAKWSLRTGSIIMVKFDVSNTASNVTLNVNGTGAYPIWYNNAEYTSTGTAYTGYANRTITYMFNGTHYVWITASYDANSTYTNAALGQGYATCSTAASTTAKVGTLSSYKLTTGGIVSVKFTNEVPANATLNINSAGAKSIYFRGAKITADVIKAGDTATFVYSSYYHLISIDRWQNDIVDIQEAIARSPATPQDYGAKGDGSTDDTTAFQNALANNRIVFVPGGAYKLSGELTIRDNCQMELAQDVVLNFTQTSGNCITMNRSAYLKGNHATVNVPYSFIGNVVNADTSVHTDIKDVPPFSHWDPQWKTARYLTDLNICKVNDDGLHVSNSGDSNGTAVYITADGSATSTFIWGLNFSGLRIAGAFEYGIRAVNIGGAYNHEMRIEAFMDACKVGVSLEDCNNAYISATVQPRKADNGTTYAEHGIKLVNTANTDLTGSRVWDWSAANSKWANGGEYQHIAMYGNCMGTIANDFHYHSLPSYVSDIREIIYTDTPSNFDSLIILQEPFTKWFKPVDNEPYFFDGEMNRQLVTKEEFDQCIDAERVPNFTDRLSSAKDRNGAVFNGIGYKKGYHWATDGVTLTKSDYHTCTGLIQCATGDKIHVKGMSFNEGDDDCRVVLYDSSFAKILHINRGNIITNGSYYYVNNYVETEDGFTLDIVRAGVAYISISVYSSTVKRNPIVTANQEISWSTTGYLQDGIKVQVEQVEGLSDILGSYINDVDALLGGS